MQAANQLPTPERRNVIRNRIMREFREARNAPHSRETSDKEGTAQWYINYGELQLENLLSQVEHLNNLSKQDLIIPVDIYQVDQKHWGRWAESVKPWERWKRKP